MEVSRLLHRKVSSPLSAGVLLSVNMGSNREGKGEEEDFFVASNDKNIELWGLKVNKSQLMLVLEGHQFPVTHLAVAVNGHCICSLSHESLLLWQLEDCLQSLASARPLPPLSCSRDDVTCLVLSHNGVHLAVAIKRMIIIIEIREESDFIVISKLFGHTHDVTFASFVPEDSTHLVTASDDRTFKIWNVLEGGLVFDSGYISSSHFMGLSLLRDYFAIGTADGKVRVYSCLSSVKCTLVREIDTKLLTNRQISLGFSEDLLVDKEIALSALLLWPVTTPSFETTPTDTIYTTGGGALDSISIYNELVTSGLWCLIYTSIGLLLIDVMSNEIISHSQSPEEEDASKVGVLSSMGETVQFWNLSNNQFLMLTSSSSSFSLFNITITNTSKKPLTVSVLSSEPLVSGSPLKAELVPTAVPPAPSRPVGRGSKTKGGSDKPVTFRSTVKSSGYLQSPHMKMFQPSMPKTKREPHPPREVTLIPDTSIADSKHKGISHLKYNTNGSHLACCGESPSIYLFKSKDNQQNLLQGHDGRVRSIEWGHAHSWLLSCSVDKSVCLWSTGGRGRGDTQCLMRINHTIHNFKEKNETNVPFPGEISNAKFYYLDKFILLTFENKLNLYKYYIDPNPPPDIKRYQSKNHYKQVISVIPNLAQSLTALSAINNFYSYIVITAGSNRSLNVTDMNTCKEVWSKDDAHSTRHVHWIMQNKGSKACGCVPQSHDLFATSAVGGGIKLWDLRTQKCVRWYTGFVNRSVPVRTSFSMCGRYIATGSEENAAIVFDLRYISPVTKLQCPIASSSVISSVDYHPHNIGLSCCSTNGSIFSFSNF
ncbi:PREDICTED: WD repeat-containing protein 27-like [Amphimedon queenslandica]|nr:PREDICTED: WD repeat-containing protein 27-like [Amphimedon queenslandica]|eukprot:XP_019849058.1 PREDICTED: WD repeat-containing protein 27-like [Amphimedon queenslandica]